MKKYGDIEVHSHPIITATCRECRSELEEGCNGWLDNVLVCKKCKIVYQIKIVKYPDSKLNKKYFDEVQK